MPQVSLLSREVPAEVGVGVGASVRGRTDGTGKVVSLDVLYTRTPERIDALLAYTRENLSVKGRERIGDPVTFYGKVGVLEDGEPGYVITAVAQAR